MKNLILLTLLLFGINSFGQTTKFQKPRYLKQPTVLCPIDITKLYNDGGLIGANTETIQIKERNSSENKERMDGKPIQVKTILRDTILVKNILIEKGNAFDVIQQIGSFSIIKFWDLRESKAKGLLKKINANKIKDANVCKKLSLDKDYNNLNVIGLTATYGDSECFDLSKNYYIVPTKTLINNSVEFENKTGLWNIGLLALPVKIRPFATESGQFDFTGGFSVGTTFSWVVHQNWQTNFTHNFLLYAGISSYKADESKIKELREDYTIATFSPAVGWMWEKNNVQLSLLVGIDFPTGNLKKTWVYRNQPWFGIGIGFGLFKIDNNTQNTNGKN